ncbi:hypothetical protein J6590_090389 [Homalodisca vitripennis]|nr:hypothetical protein J6590_090389 [Homalodisca vitripennis]
MSGYSDRADWLQAVMSMMADKSDSNRLNRFQFNAGERLPRLPSSSVGYRLLYTERYPL